jgi:hypothetical protein
VAPDTFTHPFVITDDIDIDHIVYPSDSAALGGLSEAQTGSDAPTGPEPTADVVDSNIGSVTPMAIDEESDPPTSLRARLRLHISSLQLKRGIVSDVEKAAAAMAASAACAVLRRERMDVDPGRFPLRRHKWTAPPTAVESASGAEEICKHILKLPRTPPTPTATTVPVGPDTDSEKMADLPIARGLLQALLESGRTLSHLDPVNTSTD